MAVGQSVRSCARITRHTGDASTAHEAGTVFIAGNAIELVAAGAGDGPKQTLSRIFDAHTTDKEVYEAEVAPLLDHLIEGCNISVLVAGNHRSGHAPLFNTLATAAAERLLERMQQLQLTSERLALKYHLGVRYAAVILGSEQMNDLLSGASTELRVVLDAESPGGVSIPGITTQMLSQPGAFTELLRVGRTRLGQQGRGPPLSSILFLELRQSQAGSATDLLVSTLMIADIEVGALGDALSNALRQLLASAPAQAVGKGPALLLRDALGGNGRTLLMGTLLPTDFEESAETLRLLADGVGLDTFPLINDQATRGLLARYRRQVQQLGEQLSVAEQKLIKGVEQLEVDRQHLPNQLQGAAERLQALVDRMQQDAAGHASERQKLMQELVETRSKANAASGELVAIKEELVREKQEKLQLSKQMVALQLGSNEEASERQQRLYQLEQEVLASGDVLAQLRQQTETQAAELKQKSADLEEAQQSQRRTEQQRLLLQSQMQTMRKELEDLRETQDELNLQVLNAGNAQTAAERSEANLRAELASDRAELERLRERLVQLEASLIESSAEATRCAERARAAKLQLEEQTLQHEQDTLALQRQAAEVAERQMARAEAAEQALFSQTQHASSNNSTLASQLSEAQAQLRAATARESELQRLLQSHVEQMDAMRKHGRGRAAQRTRRNGDDDDDDDDADGGADADGTSDDGNEGEEAEGKGGVKAVDVGRQPATQRQDPIREYEERVRVILQVNRALVEAYWRLRRLAEGAALTHQVLEVPSHEELLLSVQVGADGRRQVMSELEKSLDNENSRLRTQLERVTETLSAHSALEASEQRLESQQAAALAEERGRQFASAELREAKATATALEGKVRALEEQLRGEREAQRRADEQGQLMQALRQLKADEEVDVEASKRRADLLEMENDKLRRRLEQLREELRQASTNAPTVASSGACGGVRCDALPDLKLERTAHNLQVQVRELESSQAVLERECSEYKRRTASAEEQLSEMQRYLMSNLGRYQTEILRLREALKNGSPAR